MATLLKKTVGIQNIPLVVLALFLVLFIGSEVYASYNMKTNLEWVIDDSGTPDPLNPNNYEEHTGSLIDDCEQVSTICGIIAPEDPMNPGKPLISPELANRISNSITTSGDVFLKPYNPKR